MVDGPVKVILSKEFSAEVFSEMLTFGEFNYIGNLNIKLSQSGVNGYAYLFQEGKNNFIGWSGDYENTFIYSRGYYETKHSYKTYTDKDFLAYLGKLKDKKIPWQPIHKEPIWCWNQDDETRRELRFWDAKSNRPFGSKVENLSTIIFDNYEKVEHIESWMLVMQNKLEF